MSFVNLSQPSDSLTREDIENMRRGRKGGNNNGNDFRYKGKRGILFLYSGNCKLPMGGWGWVTCIKEGTEDQYDKFSINFSKAWKFWWSDVIPFINILRILAQSLYCSILLDFLNIFVLRFFQNLKKRCRSDLIFFWKDINFLEL